MLNYYMIYVIFPPLSVVKKHPRLSFSSGPPTREDYKNQLLTRLQDKNERSTCMIDFYSKNENYSTGFIFFYLKLPTLYI